jgi:2-polyprenyl-3-methyl-5-hydroxy-6-metoxy-1,4-benzoquinol methylase
MTKRKHSASYNERLFARPGIRSYLHLARFRWFAAKAAKLTPLPQRIVELGCFDGKLLDYLPAKPIQYQGLDADWEGGLSAATARYDGQKHLSFTKATTPGDLAGFRDNEFDLGVAMETLEHVPPELVPGYLAELARIVKGHLLVTVPNEKGPLLLAKWGAKLLMSGSTQNYTPTELLNGVRGDLSAVRRDNHKGFDYDVLIEQIQQHFDVLSVETVPFSRLPRPAAFTVGIIARSRPD